MQKQMPKPSWTQENSYEALGLGDLAPVAILLVVVFLIVAVGAYILTEVQTTLPVNSQAANITGKGLGAFVIFGNWFAILVTIVVAALVIGLLLYAFRGPGEKGL